jgi:hypothetical protein
MVRTSARALTDCSPRPQWSDCHSHIRCFLGRKTTWSCGSEIWSQSSWDGTQPHVTWGEGQLRSFSVAYNTVPWTGEVKKEV